LKKWLRHYRTSRSHGILISVSWGYRKSRRLGRGVRLNVGKRGLGVSVGPLGAKLSANTRGQRSLSLSLLGFFFRRRL
jgi:hypothetical protein